MEIVELLWPTLRLSVEVGSEVTVKSTMWNTIEAVACVRVPFTPVTVTE